MRAKKIIGTDGSIEYRLPSGALHRVGKPAVIYGNGGYRSWWCHGKLHNPNGPAAIWKVSFIEEKTKNGVNERYHLPNNTESTVSILLGKFEKKYIYEWWIDGKQLSQEEIEQIKNDRCWLRKRAKMSMREYIEYLFEPEEIGQS